LKYILFLFGWGDPADPTPSPSGEDESPSTSGSSANTLVYPLAVVAVVGLMGWVLYCGILSRRRQRKKNNAYGGGGDRGDGNGADGSRRRATSAAVANPTFSRDTVTIGDRDKTLTHVPWPVYDDYETVESPAAAPAVPPRSTAAMDHVYESVAPNDQYEVPAALTGSHYAQAAPPVTGRGATTKTSAPSDDVPRDQDYNHLHHTMPVSIASRDVGTRTTKRAERGTTDVDV
jgi:hypothetical protein